MSATLIFLIAIISLTTAKPLENTYGPPQYNPPPVISTQQQNPSPFMLQKNPSPFTSTVITQQNPPPYTSQQNPSSLVSQQTPSSLISQQNPAQPESINNLKAPITNTIIIPQRNLVPPVQHQTPSTNIFQPPLTVFEQQPLIQKYFYFHSAPQEPEEKETTKVIKIGQPRKHYRIVFIRTPAPIQPQSLEVIPAPSEEKTVIYVLAKHIDGSDIQTEFNVTPTEPSKPEVFFIKYKTDREAEHAQNQIQAQYDALGGTTEVSDEGLAPVSSVIGALNRNDNKQIANQNEQLNNYLPPN